MKVILREYGGDHYVVKDVNLNEKGKFVCDDDIIADVNILTVLDKSKKNFVKCSCCGETFPNNSKAIAAHRAAHKTYNGCYGCRYLRINQINKDIGKFSRNDDGTFNRKINDKVKLHCGNSYRGYSLDDSITNGTCAYSRCANATIEPIKTFFDEYPNAFDDMVTVDAIKDIKEIGNYSSYTRLRLKCRGNIYAIVNKKGIIEKFQFESRYDRFEVYYSKKYDKLFCARYGNYSEFSCPYNMSSERFEYIKETIAKLYN